MDPIILGAVGVGVSIGAIVLGLVLYNANVQRADSAQREVREIKTEWEMNKIAEEKVRNHQIDQGHQVLRERVSGMEIDDRVDAKMTASQYRQDTTSAIQDLRTEIVKDRIVPGPRVV